MARSLIERRRTHRYPLSAEEKLALTLRLLVTGDDQQSFAFSYRLGRSSVNVFFRKTCKALQTALKPKYMPIPTIADWEKIAQEFGLPWNFPLCLGALDGNDVQIKATANSGSLFSNYKKTLSTVLLAAADAKYRCVFCDVRAYVRQSDGGVFQNSGFSKPLETGAQDIPKRGKLPHSDIEMPYVFVADETFDSKKHLLRPFPGNVNYEQREQLRIVDS